MSDTPETDATVAILSGILEGFPVIVEKAKKLERDRAFLRRWRDAAVATGLYRADTDISTPEKWRSAQAAALASLLSERDDLRRWKTEALTVMPPYQEIGQEIGVTLGSSIHDKILPELVRRREEIETLRREQATTTIEGDETPMYVIETRTIRLKKYNPKFGDDRKCECGHSYYRHFDWGDEDSGCSCKYCGCNDFLEVDPLVVPD